MKYLSDYIQDAQTEAFNEAGAFFAFSKDQFTAERVKGVKYVDVGYGLLCPKGKAGALVDKLEKVHTEGIAQDLKENGKAGVIERELYNHEAFYTWSTESTADALGGYNISREEIQKTFSKVWEDMSEEERDQLN